MFIQNINNELINSDYILRIVIEKYNNPDGFTSLNGKKRLLAYGKSFIEPLTEYVDDNEIHIRLMELSIFLNFGLDKEE